MNYVINLSGFFVFALVISLVALRLYAKQHRRTAEVLLILGLLLVVFGTQAAERRNSGAAGDRLAGALILLEDRIKQNDKTSALGIVDRAIRIFGAHDGRFEERVGELWDFAAAQRKSSNDPRQNEGKTAEPGATDNPVSAP